MHAAGKCEANTYGWACESECKCRSDKHCNRFTGPTPQCRCKDGFFNPPECEPGTYYDTTTTTTTTTTTASDDTTTTTIATETPVKREPLMKKQTKKLYVQHAVLRMYLSLIHI